MPAQFTAKEKKFLLWAVFIIIGPGLLFTHTCTDKISSGMRYSNVNKSKEQKAYAKLLLAQRKDAVVDPATGYVICGVKRKFILHEPVVRIKSCDGNYVTLKKSFMRRFKAAMDYCKKTKNVCINVYGSLRSNIHTHKSNKKRKKRHFKFWASPTAKSCTDSHNMGQAFDVLNFAASFECLQREGFHGGWTGLLKDPGHFFDPKLDIISVPTGWKAKWKAAKNKAWCATKRWCRFNLRAK